MMEKGSAVFSARAAALFLLLAGQAFADGGVPKSVWEQIRPQFPSTNIDNIRKTPLPGIYEVTTGRNIFYTSAGSPVVLLGHLYDTSQNVDLTQPRLDELRAARVAWGDLPLADAIRHGDGEIKLALFTDPDCPYCRKLEQELARIEGATVYRFLFPLASLHPQATDRSRRILCNSNPDKSYLEYVQTQREPKGRNDCKSAQAVERNVALGQKLGFTGTPVLVRQDGAVLLGYLPLAPLKKWIAQDGAGLKSTAEQASATPALKGGEGQ